MSTLDQLWSVVRRIPSGRVASYGTVGKAMPRPVSGVLIGKWMASCPPDVCWWRVVGSDGRLPVGKRSPLLEREQRERLRSEGVEIEDDCVSKNAFIPVEFLIGSE